MSRKKLARTGGVTKNHPARRVLGPIGVVACRRRAHKGLLETGRVDYVHNHCERWGSNITPPA